MDRTADLLAEDLVDQPVLLDATAPFEGLGGDGRAEVIAAAGVVLDLGVRTRNCGLDALLDVSGVGISCQG